MPPRSQAQGSLRENERMTKLAAIIDGATGEAVSTASLLRMLKVVASRLQTSPLEDWVDPASAGRAAV